MAVRARLVPPREVKTEWPWHEAKTSSIRASLLFAKDRRMEAESYLADGFGIRLSFEAHDQGWDRLVNVARMWQPSRLKGIQVSRENGVPFLAATQVYDFRPAPRKWLSPERTNNIEIRFGSPGMILVTCSGTVGRAVVADSTLENTLISHDLLRVEAKEPGWWGWIYAYLRAPTVRKMMKAAEYGHMIKHLEVSHLNALPVLILRKDLRVPFDSLVQEIINLRDRAHELNLRAEDEFLTAIGEPLQSENREGFTIRGAAMFGQRRRMEGYHYNPAARAAEVAIQSGAVRVEMLGDLVDRVFVPGRFKHVYGPEGVPYLDSAQIVELAPDVTKRVLSLNTEKRAGYNVERGTLLIPSSGQLHGIIGSVVMAGQWHEGKVLSNHIMRIVPKRDPEARTGYLQAVLSHPVLGRPRVIKEAFGSSVPEIDAGDIARLAIPRLQSTTEDSIADAMEEAATLRSQADNIEDEIAAKADEYVKHFLAGNLGNVEPTEPTLLPVQQ